MIRRLQVHTTHSPTLDAFVEGMEAAGWSYVKDEQQGPITAVVMQSPEVSRPRTLVASQLLKYPPIKVDEKRHFGVKGD